MTDASSETLRERLHDIVFEADTPAGKAFDVGLIVAILLSIVAVSLESVETPSTTICWSRWSGPSPSCSR